MANGNGSSSSSSFSSFSGIGDAANNKGNNFKSNSQNTFDIFNINVKDAQSKIEKVFDFTLRKVEDNEKSINRSIDKIFNNINSKMADQSIKFSRLSSKSFSDLNTNIENSANKYKELMESSIEDVISSSQEKYDSLYRDISNKHNDFVQNAKTSEEKLISDFQNALNDIEININTTDIANDIASKLSSMKIQCKCICDCCGDKENDKDNGIDKALLILLTDRIISKISNKVSQNNNERTNRTNNILNNINRSTRRIEDNTDDDNDEDNDSLQSKLLNIIVDAFKQAIDMLWNKFIGGAEKWYNQYESSYTQLSSAFNTNRKETHDLAIQGTKNLEKINGSMIKAINFAEDYLPMLEEVSKQGLMGDNAVAKAVSDSIDKKIMPWLETSSDQWVNMNTYLSQENLNTLKGQQLMLQKMESGNRLLQSGVINSMTNDMEPLLRNIDFNTGGAENLSEESKVLMTSLVENANMTPQEAYEQVQKAVNVQKDQYGALTSGNVDEILMGIEAVQGGSLIDMMQNSTKRIADIAESTESNLGVSAVYHGLGGDIGAYTVENAEAISEALSDRMLRIIRAKTGYTYSYIDDRKPSSFYDKAVEDIKERVTINKSTNNVIENWGSKIFGFISTEIPLFWESFHIISDAVSKIYDVIKDEVISGLFASGSDEIPYDGFIAKLHKGETVFNAKSTKIIKDVLGMTGKSVGESEEIRDIKLLKKDKLEDEENKSNLDLIRNINKSNDKDKTDTILDKISNIIIKGSYASGSHEIPYDGFIAKLHKGETVFNAKASKRIKDILGINGESVGESPLLRSIEIVKDKLFDKEDKQKTDSYKEDIYKNKIFDYIRNNNFYVKTNDILDLFNNGDVSERIKLNTESIEDIIGSFASGKDNVERDGYAELHEGEMIIDNKLSNLIKKSTGITATSVSNSDTSSILDRIREHDTKIIDKNNKESKFDDSKLIKAIAEAATKIVKAVSEDHKENDKMISKIQKTIGKVKVSYDSSIVNMEPID